MSTSTGREGVPAAAPATAVAAESPSAVASGDAVGAAVAMHAPGVREPTPPTWNPQPEPSRARKAVRALRWLPGFLFQRVARARRATSPAHLVIAVADHFEPAFAPRMYGFETSECEQEARVERWCRLSRATSDEFRDVNGFPFVHTYFLPAEEWYPSVVERLASFARAGHGELEVQLHHGVTAPDTAERTRATLETFRDVLVAHGCLSRWNDAGPPRYGFVHGNWALANSNDGRCCGVDSEFQLLEETGCYADFTLPSAPSPAQVGKSNSMYECTGEFAAAAPHRFGRDLAVGRPPERFPLVVQGPLGVYLPRGEGDRRILPRVENGEISRTYQPTPQRIDAWRRAAISVEGRPDWVFIKLHTHGLEGTDFDTLVGPQRRALLTALRSYAREGGHTLHYVTAREMVNIALAACDGHDGNPADYRDYRLRLVSPR
jgi:hypothetical protein